MSQNDLYRENDFLKSISSCAPDLKFGSYFEMFSIVSCVFNYSIFSLRSAFVE